MSGLLELNETLKQQGDKLGSIDKGIANLVKTLSKDPLEDLEKQRDSKEKRGVLGGFMGGSGKRAGRGSGNSMLSNLGFGLGGFGLGALSLGGMLKGFGLLSAGVVGISSLMTPENVEKLNTLGDTLSDIGEDVSSYFENIELNLPNIQDIGNKVTGITGTLLDTVNNMLTLDFDGIQNNLANNAGDLAVAAAAAKRAIGGKPTPKPATPVKPSTPMTKAQRQQVNAATGKSLSAKKIKALEKQGYKVNKSGALSKGGKAVSVEDTDKAFKKAGIKTSTSAGGILKKFPRVLKLFKIPGISAALSLGSILSILADDSTTAAEKTEKIAGALGSIGGGLLGVAAGATVGSVVPGFGTLVGGLLGGAAGSLFFEELATSIAKWALGGDNKGLEELNKIASQVDSNSVAGMSAGADDPFSFSMPQQPKKGFSPNVEGQALKALQTESSVLQTAAANVTVVSPTTNNVTNGSASVSIGGGITVTDSLDQGTR